MIQQFYFLEHTSWVQNNKCIMVSQRYYTQQPNPETPTCPTAVEWLEKLWYVYTMKCYMAKRKDAIRWMDLERIIMREVTER